MRNFSEIYVEYNKLDYGPKINFYGSNSALIRISIMVNDVKKTLESKIILPGHFYQLFRQWYCEWIIECYEWRNGELVKIKDEIFNPYGKKIHFILEHNSSFVKHKEYLRACIEFIDRWDIYDYTIESKFANLLIKENPDINIVETIVDNDCYVNFHIKRDHNPYIDNFTEMVYYNSNSPHNPENMSDYELAKSILFGPNYDLIEEYLPHDESLT